MRVSVYLRLTLFELHYFLIFVLRKQAHLVLASDGTRLAMRFSRNPSN